MDEGDFFLNNLFPRFLSTSPNYRSDANMSDP